MNKPEKVLILDEDEETLNALRIVAQIAGIENPVCCRDGRTAAARLIEEAFSVIVCRDELPPEDGFQFIQGLRKRGLQTPVLFVSRTPATWAILATAHIEHSDLLAMPFTLAAFTGKLHTMRHSH